MEKIFLHQENEEIPLILTNLRKRSEKHAQQQSAKTEQWFCATLAVPQYVRNALIQFAQTVLNEHKRQVA